MKQQINKSAKSTKLTKSIKSIKSAKSTKLTKLKATPRSKLVRLTKRGSYDRKTVYDIIDGMVMCSVAYNIKGKPYCTPTLHWREGDYIYWHGSSISRFLKQVTGESACITITHFDGLVLARSAFHHSANYRSVMLFGKAQLVAEDEKVMRLKNFMEGILPGRWDTLRPVTRKELNATIILKMKLDEGCAKVRAGDPGDNKSDYKLPIWAGVIPSKQKFAKPEADPLNLKGVALPADVKKFRLKN